LWGTGACSTALLLAVSEAVDARVFNISRWAMITDPLGTVPSVYEGFELSFSAAAQRGAKAWLEHPAQHMSSVKFTLTDFGFDTHQVEAAHSRYRQRLGDFF